jgi:MFS family permease
LSISTDLSKRIAVLSAAIPLICLIFFVSQHLVNIPWGESWTFAKTLIIPADDHTLPISGLTMQFADHRPVTYYLVSILDLFATRWDLRAYPFITILQALTWITLLGMQLKRQNNQAFYLALLPMSCLIFAINLSVVWIRGYFDQLFYPLLITASLYVITSQPRGWRPLIISCMLSVCALYSTLVGITAFLVLPFALWLAGYRRVWHFAFWAAAFLASLWLYFTGWQQSKLTQPLSGPLLMVMLDVTQYALAVLGSVFSKTEWIATVLPIAGGLMAALNIYRLRKEDNFWRLMTPWLGMLAYGLVAAFLTSIGRLGSGISDFMMTKPHYSIMGAIFWLAVIALGGMVCVNARHARWLMYANLAVLAVLAPLYVQNNFKAAITFQLPDSSLYGPSSADETCVRFYPIDGNTDCFQVQGGTYWFKRQYAPTAYELAQRRLATFAFSDNVQAVMPSAYEDGDIIVVDGSLAAQHIPLVSPDGKRISESTVVHLLDFSQLQLYAGQTSRVITGESPAQLRAFADDIRGAHRVWYLSALQRTSFSSALLNILREQFIRLPGTHTPQVYKDTWLFIEKSAN